MTIAGSLSRLDQIIILGYGLLTLAIGLYFSRRAAAGLTAYFLGGRSIPWWMLGLSGTASNFDMTGTMVIVSFFYAIGVQGFWVAMRGGMALPYGVLMVYMGRWLWRSRVLTTAEWMELRFGSDRAGKLARLVSAIANLILTLSLLVYFVEGAGKFLAVYLPWSPTLCALALVVVAVVYTTLSGFYGVIYTDIVQEVLLVGVSAYLGVRAFTLPTHADAIASAVTSFPSWQHWWPQWQADPMLWLENPLIYQSFGLCIIFWIARGVLEGAGGYSGGYAPQRFYAARTEREASFVAAEWIVLLLFRWALVMGIVILGLDLARSQPDVGYQLSLDPEQTLPLVIRTALPSGLRGLVITGMVAAAMSTFDSTINAGVAYWVNDIYKPYLHPDADDTALLRQSYGGTVVLALLAIALSQVIHNINDIWSWITGPLAAGLVGPIVLRWYWWRLNGYGFAAGTVAGLGAAIALKVAWPGLAFYQSFVLILSGAVLVAVLVSYATPATDRAILQAFWLQIKPFGLWSAVSTTLDSGQVEAARNDHLRSGVNLLITLCWQVSSVLAIIALLLHQWTLSAAGGGVFLGLSGVLWLTWYRPLMVDEVMVDEVIVDEG